VNTILSGASKKSEEHENYNPIPSGYEVGKNKYVIVYGTVMSGLGKGIFASSLAKLLQLKGLKVNQIKFEGYLNVDAGTLNPIRHGEVFVLDDGTETDMDLGTYERFLEQNLSIDNFATNGQIFASIFEKERKGSYLGRDVQYIPHVTGEIKLKLRNLAVKSKADVIFVEIGGTVGDLENSHYIEAMRELALEEGKENVCQVALTYVIEPNFLGEQKSKAAQLGLKELMRLGIQPDIIACRCEHEVKEKVREKIGISACVPVERVISVHDAESIYLIPSLLRKYKLDEQTINLLKLNDKVNENSEQRSKWESYVYRILGTEKEVTIGITGKYTSLHDSYASVIKALEHSGAYNGTKVNLKWIDTSFLSEEKVSKELVNVDGIIVPGAFGSRGAEGKISCIKYARENKIPYLGLCFGFQMAVVEYARNVCELGDANSTEVNQNALHPVIDLLPEQKAISAMGGNMRLGGHDIEIKPGTMAEELYESCLARERFRHRWECNPAYIPQLEMNGLIFSGKAPNREIMQILELPREIHPFFMATQAHPEFTSTPLRPNPLYMGFMKAAVSLAEAKYSSAKTEN
jgi:CTP synthase